MKLAIKRIFPTNIVTRQSRLPHKLIKRADITEIEIEVSII
jgi:hypothetical protein